LLSTERVEDLGSRLSVCRFNRDTAELIHTDELAFLIGPERELPHEPHHEPKATRQERDRQVPAAIGARASHNHRLKCLLRLDASAGRHLRLHR
jgi:hypothetical protein